MCNRLKTLAIALSVALGLLVSGSSCQKEFEIRFGFDSQFNKDSYGTTIMFVNKDFDKLKLEGGVTINQGEIQVELINPRGSSAFSKRIISPDKLYISETFGSIPGNWKLKYQSYDGTGIIRLHMNTSN